MAFNREKNFVFQVVSQQGREQFEIWKGWDYKSTPLIDPNTGQEMKFPIKEGQLVGQDGVARDVNEEIKYMKAPDFKAKYPWYSKRTTFIWDVLINGQQMANRFSKTSNGQLIELMNTVMALGKNPHDQLFYQKFDKSKPPAQMYEIGLAQNDQQVQSAQQMQQPQQPVQNSYQGVNIQAPPAQQQQPTQDVPQGSTNSATTTQSNDPSGTSNINTPNVTNFEKRFMEAIKNKYKDDKKLNSNDFVDICKKNGIDSERAKELFVNDYE